MACCFQWLSTAVVIFSILSNSAFGANTTEPKLPSFGDTVQILGAMQRTDQDFQDGLALDLFSPKNRTLVVQQNKTPLAGHFVSGSNGEPFVAVSSYSYIIKLNETANDLIAKIEVPYDPVKLNAMGVQEANTYVGTLAADKKSWIINEQARNVHRSENLTRIIKMTSLDGEYLLLGRQSVDTSNIFVQYGQGATRTVNITGGQGIQQAEFIDGLRFSVQADTAMNMNVDIIQGVNPGTLPNDTESLNSFMWVINTTNPNAKLTAKMRVPFNRMMLANLKPAGSSPTTMLTVAKRALNATSGQFIAVNADSQVVHELTEDRISVGGLTELDGQYIILVTPPRSAAQGTRNTTSTSKTTLSTSTKPSASASASMKISISTSTKSSVPTSVTTAKSKRTTVPIGTNDITCLFKGFAQAKKCRHSTQLR